MNKKDVLSVEDDRYCAENIKSRLESLGHNVTAILPTAEAAIRHEFDPTSALALIDIHLEGEMGGIWLLKHFRERYHIPVLYITAHSDPETLKKALELDPDGFLLKTVTPALLQSALELVLARHDQIHRIQDQLENYQTILHGLGAGVIYFTKSGSVIDVNKAFCRITGLHRREVVGKNALNLIKKFIPTQDQARITSLVINLISGQRIETYSLEFRGKILEIIPLLDYRAKVLSGLVRNITQQERKKDRLRLFERIVTNFKFGLVAYHTTDPDNPASLRLHSPIPWPPTSAVRP